MNRNAIWNAWMKGKIGVWKANDGNNFLHKINDDSEHML